VITENRIAAVALDAGNVRSRSKPKPFALEYTSEAITDDIQQGLFPAQNQTSSEMPSSTARQLLRGDETQTGKLTGQDNQTARGKMGEMGKMDPQFSILVHS
jgi:hypothetical protein